MKKPVLLLAAVFNFAHASNDATVTLKRIVLHGLKKISSVADYRQYREFLHILAYQQGEIKITTFTPNAHSNVTGTSESIYFKPTNSSVFAPVFPWANLIIFKDTAKNSERAVLNLQISTEPICLTKDDFISLFADASLERNFDSTLEVLSHRVPGQLDRTVSSLFSGGCAINFIASQNN